jgi:ABC-type polysaccharide/polyol phosphate transport system ATPase subunit
MHEPRGYVEFTNVWKKFRYGEMHNRLRDAIPAAARALFRRSDPDAGLWHGEFWALREISFRVLPGEALGLIGPNGAGKSTILKLLTRIMHQTHGRSIVRGRIGALIEVAAGFHPDLTGRENTYLQGAIMGMSRREITRRFDEIVDFSGVEPFIDMPVKRYSSGMQARLGFAIAAHLDPDVLVVDEVLAVGDAAFQQKAFARVQALVKGAIPVVVVSHQLHAITSLCTHGLLLDRGQVVHRGTPDACVLAYLGGAAARPRAATGDGAITIESMQVSHAVCESGDSVSVSLECVVRDEGWTEPESIRIGVRSAANGDVLFESSTLEMGVAIPASGRFRVAVTLQMNVQRGVYLLESQVWHGADSRTSFTGPATSIDVRDGHSFQGMVQMNAHGQVLREPLPAPAS